MTRHLREVGKKQVIYLDYAATTPMSEDALYVFNEAVKKFYGNPSSLHDIGSQAKGVLDVCRTQWQGMINGEENSIYFTSGGSESNILAILSLVDGNIDKGNHLITTEVEHSSVYHAFKKLEKDGFDVTYLPINNEGLICLKQLQNAIKQETVLASIHHGNSEIGVVQQITEIGEVLHENNVIFHTDTVQTFGELLIDVKASKVDSLSVSSHKLYGPKSTGMCYINPNVKWGMQIEGTTHEGGFRPGTVDVPSILAFTTAAQQVMKEMDAQQAKYKRLRARFVSGIKRMTNKVIVEGGGANQLPQIIGLSFLQVQGQHIMLECNRYGIAISTGTACQVGQQSPSRTMMSIGKTAEEAMQFVRISFGKMTTESEVDDAVRVLTKIING